VALEVSAIYDRRAAPALADGLDVRTLLARTQARALPDLWARLRAAPHPAAVGPFTRDGHAALCPESDARIAAAATRVLDGTVDLMGSGPVALGSGIEWLKDYKSGFTWVPQPCAEIDYSNLDRPSDVKFPWELSRLQWVIPAAQSYALHGDDLYAARVRDILDSWIRSNPYGMTVNWSCTMEAALRIVSWTWLFRIFSGSAAWSDEAFRRRFLSALYLHGQFTHRHLEYGVVNGNHCTADAVGLLVCGLFFGRHGAARRWADDGWALLCEELPRQVFPDGVDFEGSIPYHRLVLELFLVGALARSAAGLDVPESYRSRLAAMARFVEAYSKPGGCCPLVGDADDARVLPFGHQALNDHRYLVRLVGAFLADADLLALAGGPLDEVYWLMGPAAARQQATGGRRHDAPESRAFRDGGFFVLRNARDHVFIDCGPIGLAGRGGHGHNDCLSFEAVIDGEPLVTDAGAFVYTASTIERDRFRSTASHNTPRIDGEEINRFVPGSLWTLQYDATPELRQWTIDGRADVFCGAHAGYRRLGAPVTPIRRIVLDHATHTLTIEDHFDGNGAHEYEIPLLLVPGVTAAETAPGRWFLRTGARAFELSWAGSGGWECRLERGDVSERYGVRHASARLLWQCRTSESPVLTVRIRPGDRAGA
jgi:hypothetical protein